MRVAGRRIERGHTLVMCKALKKDEESDIFGNRSLKDGVTERANAQ